jgi:hypothetical protein
MTMTIMRYSQTQVMRMRPLTTASFEWTASDLLYNLESSMYYILPCEMYCDRPLKSGNWQVQRDDGPERGVGGAVSCDAVQEKIVCICDLEKK